MRDDVLKLSQNSRPRWVRLQFMLISKTLQKRSSCLFLKRDYCGLNTQMFNMTLAGFVF